MIPATHPLHPAPRPLALSQTATFAADPGLSQLVRLGLISIAVLVLGLGALITFLPMAGAVIAPGEVTVESHVKELSHPFGGVVAQILVKDGDAVRQGQPLIRLDSRVSGAVAEYTGLSLNQLLAKAARLRAVQAGTGDIDFPRELEDKQAGDPGVRTILADERSSFRLANAARRDQVGQLRARIAQTQAEITSFNSQAGAYQRQSALVRQELQQTRELYESRLTTLDRLNALERSAVGVEAQQSTARSGVAETWARIAELRAQIVSVESTARSEAALELAQVQGAIADLRKESVAASDQNDRTVIRAPQDGTVDKLQTRTIGSVVRAGETLMEIVPSHDHLVVRGHVRLTDIDKVSRGQTAHLRFTALNARTTPELAGKVTQVAADRTVDTATNNTFYPVTIAISDAEFRKLGNARISVGMPVEVFIQTEQRTILQYIIRPLSDQFRRALRE
ncbi:HlyD family secretion protein [Novosphingobium sp. PhB57]|uniref:HlyD family type I secretion periplasmic adaptor subunit n=1 Tax=Novosphingobium sp. PhB57 TaxID=2485107 RepID=UPI001042E3AC|nr:HlyD family type I secretion periplasmic adaptor subunit [Novosphingobium sp. PhB57]TCU57330.1 HlyD family secretion protein [Novosphingobium sp. PhB57]